MLLKTSQKKKKRRERQIIVMAPPVDCASVHLSFSIFLMHMSFYVPIVFMIMDS